MNSSKIHTDLISNNPKLKKGDTCFLVSIEQGHHWRKNDGLEMDNFNGQIACREVTIKSLGKIQGTAIDTDGTFMNRQIHVGYQIMVKTKEDCFAIAQTYKANFLENGKKHLANSIESEVKWNSQYAGKARADILAANEQRTEALRNHSFSDAVVFFY